jgi:hypothetical protein
MGIMSNDDKNQTNEGKGLGPDERPGFAGPTMSAPTGALDFLSIVSKMNVNRIDAAVEPYLKDVLKIVQDELGVDTVSLEPIEKMGSAYAFKYQGLDGNLYFFGVLFMSLYDQASTSKPASDRLKGIVASLREKYSQEAFTLLDARVIVSNYPAEMDRSFQMGSTIVRTFAAASMPELKNITVRNLQSTQFEVDWNPAEAAALESSWSPHGVRPRMAISMTVKAKIRQSWGRPGEDYEAEYRPLGVIGGYMEIREHEPVYDNYGGVKELYRPVFNITVCNALIAHPAVACFMLAAVAPTITNKLFWIRQWNQLSDGHPNPGNLEPDPDRPGLPIHLNTQEELRYFVEAKFATPVIAFQFQDGKDGIPGLWKMGSTRPEDKQQFLSQVAAFFGTEASELSRFPLSNIIGSTYDGVYGDVNGELTDSRKVDFLSIAANNGVGSITPEMRALLLTSYGRAEDKAKVIRDQVQTFVALYTDTQVVTGFDFIKAVIGLCDQNGLTLVDPDNRGEGRAFGSYIDGLGSAANMGTIVQAGGMMNRGTNYGSVWTF